MVELRLGDFGRSNEVRFVMRYVGHRYILFAIQLFANSLISP